jgi:hypothetical protein
VQALIAGQVDEAGVPGVDVHPAAGLGAVLPAGLTAAGLVDAQHPGGFRLAQQPRGGATKARCAVGHDTPWAIATSVTERAASPIAAPIWVRNRRVVRARAGTCGIASVNEPRSQ